MTETTLSEREQRDIWAALPLIEAYPIGSQWHYVPYGGSEVFTVTSHYDNERLGMTGNSDWEQDWPRTALDDYGTPVGGAISPAIKAGDRVKVTRDDDRPEWVGREGDVLEVQRQPDGTYMYRLSLDATPSLPDRSSWWVAGVELLTEETPVTFTQADVDAAVGEAVREARRELHEEFESWKESLTDDAHRYATEQNYCSEFDRFMTDHGLRGREREFKVVLTIAGTVTVMVTAGSADDAEEMACDDYDISDLDVNTVEICSVEDA